MASWTNPSLHLLQCFHRHVYLRLLLGLVSDPRWPSHNYSWSFSHNPSRNDIRHILSKNKIRMALLFGHCICSDWICGGDTVQTPSKRKRIKESRDHSFNLRNLNAVGGL